MKSAALFLAVSAALLTGCTSTSYTDPSGAKFSRISVLNSQSIGKVDIKAGDKTLTIEGYSSEQAQIASAVVSAAVRSAIVTKP
jgi:hypothetical protein